MEDMDTEEQLPPNLAPPNLASQAWGIEEIFYDIWGKTHKTSPEAQQAILKSLGVDDVEKAFSEKLWAEWSRPLPPTIVRGAKGALAISLPESKARETIELTFIWEDSRQARQSFDLASIPVAEEIILRDEKFVRKPLTLPADAPLGYHALRFEAAETRLIVCPERCFLPEKLHAGGIGVSLYAVRSGRNWGCGDFTDLKALIDWAAEETGASFVALNPLHSLANRAPYNTSPYLPNSVFFYNLLYLDLEQIPEFSRSATRLDEVRDEINRLRNSEFVEYEGVAKLKLAVLESLFGRLGDDSARVAAFRAYVQSAGEPLQRFATHAALDHELHRRNPEAWNFTQWPEEFRHPDSPAVLEFARQHQQSILFYQYIQWQLEEQLKAAQAYAIERGLGIGLYHDLALAID